MIVASGETPVVIRAPLGVRAGTLVATGLIGVILILLLASGVYLLTAGWIGLGILLAGLSVVMAGLFRYVLRDARARWGWRIAIGDEAIDLDLPKGRSLAGGLSPVHRRVRLDDAEAVETRLEAYQSLGLANMQRSFALKLKTGERIVLGEDRALGTWMATPLMASNVEQIVTLANLALRDLGMVLGGSGLFMVAFAASPRWDTPSLDADHQKSLWNKARLTGRIAVYGSILVGVLSLIGLIFAG